MKTFKKFFFLTALIAIVFTSFTVEAQAQRAAVEEIRLNFEEIKVTWNVARIPNKIPDGKLVLATHKRNGTALIAVVRGGKIAQVGMQPVRGQFKVLEPSEKPCSSAGFCTTFQIVRCYTMPWGDCICICGGFLTAG